MNRPSFLLAALCTAFAAFLLPACSSMEPPYPAEAIAFDDGLAGTWESVPAEGAKEGNRVRVVIEAREVPINRGRVDAGQINGDGTLKADAAKAEGQAKAYRLTLSDGEKTTPLLGIAFKAGSRTLLGVQVAASRLSETGLDNWVLPVHQVFQIERSGDELRVRGMVVRVGWVPAVEFLDGSSGTSDTLRTLTDEKAGAHITTNIDRLLAIYREAAAKESAWEEAKLVLKRVKP